MLFIQYAVQCDECEAQVADLLLEVDLADPDAVAPASLPKNWVSYRNKHYCPACGDVLIKDFKRRHLTVVRG